MSSTLSALYSVQPLVVWVEDEATRVALLTAWAGDPVAIHIGGSNTTIRAVAEDAWRNQINHVFGVVDRDQGKSNFSQWAAPPEDLRTYVLQSPVIENLALDPQAIADCAYNVASRTEAQIAAKIHDAVSDMTWWMACCCVLSTAQRKRNEGVPGFPSIHAVSNFASAHDHITRSDWFSRTATELPQLAQSAWVAQELQREHARLSASVSAGQWRSEFSGKQVFHRVSEFVFTQNAGSDKNTMLLQAVIKQQASTNTLPSELRDLRASLRARVRLP